MARKTNKGPGGVREGSGRKPFEDPAKVRSTSIRFHLTEGELNKIKSAAGSVSLSTFIRNIVMRAIKRRKK